MATARFGMTLNEVTTSLLNRNTNEANNFQLIDNLAMMLTKSNVLSDGIYIATDKIRARDGDGLQLQDAVGNGITIANGGLITLAGHHLKPAASSNMFFGLNAGYSNTTGNSNSFFGYYAGYANTTGSYNAFFGRHAGTANTTGSNLTCIGYNAQPSSASATNEITLGNASVATLRCKTQTITALSDRRDKTDIEPIQLGLDFVRDLKPVRWVWNCRDGSRIGDEDTGFIAQDLDDSQQKFGYEIPGLVFKPSDDRWEASSGKLLPVAIKAIQELAEKVELLEDQINA